MKIVLDIDKLLQEGRITIAECSRLKGLPGQESRSLAFNTLIAFGVSGRYPFSQ